MRGTILMWSVDKGVVSAEGPRYDFGINEWKGNTAPAAPAWTTWASEPGSS